MLTTSISPHFRKLIRSNSNLQAKLSAISAENNKQLSSSIPTISEFVTNISRQSSISSQKSSCSGILINGQLRCCHDIESYLVQSGRKVTVQRHDSGSSNSSTSDISNNTATSRTTDGSDSGYKIKFDKTHEEKSIQLDRVNENKVVSKIETHQKNRSEDKCEPLENLKDGKYHYDRHVESLSEVVTKF